MDNHLPVIVIELVLVFGGVLLFGWWQLRDVKRDQDATAAKKRAEAEQHHNETASTKHQPDE